MEAAAAMGNLLLSWDLTSARWLVGVVYLVVSVCLLATAVALQVARRWPWCGCKVCRAYMSGSWARDFASVSDWYAHLLRRSPTTRTLRVHVLGCTVTADPGNVEYMLRTGFDNFPKGKGVSAILSDLLGGGIFNVDGDAWRHQRKMASFQLGSVAVRSYAFRIVAREVDARLMPLLARAADVGMVVDLQDVFRRFAFDTICKISFGLDPGCLDLDMPMSDAAAAFDTATRLSAVRGMAVSPLLWKMKRLLSVGGEGELKKAIKVVHELAHAMIRERRSLGVDNKSPDLLSRFMSAGSGTNTNAMDHDNEDKFLRDIVVSFLIAGRDTISSGLTTLFMLLSKHPAAGAAMRAEATKASDANAMTYEELKALHYTHAAVHESLRLFPPVQFDSKFCAAADVLPDGTYVDAGSRVMYHPYAMGRMPSIWGDDCEEFRPERWLTGAGATFEPVSLFKYPVFQAGLRVCLGKELAMMEMKAVCVAVLRAFDVKVVGERAVRECAPVFAPGLSASIQGGLPVKVSRV